MLCYVQLQELVAQDFSRAHAGIDYALYVLASLIDRAEPERTYVTYLAANERDNLQYLMLLPRYRG